MSVSEAPSAPERLGGHFWRLWTSSALSNLADGVFKVVLPLVAVGSTSSPSTIAGLAVALTLPWLLFALPAGALADRWDRRRSMLAANAVRAGLMIALTVTSLLGLGDLWLLFVVAFSVGTTETIYDTSAQSIVPQLVGRSMLPRANGRLFAAELTANQFVGPPLGGLIVVAGAAVSFAAPAALWVAAIGALMMVKGSFRVTRERPTTIRADVAEGLRFLWHDRLLRLLAIMVGTANFAGNAVWAILVLYAVGPGSAMGLSEPGYGGLLAVIAVGSLIGALLAERIERLLGRTWALTLGIATAAALVGAPAVTSNVAAIAVAVFIGGMGAAVWNVITVSLRQQVTPDRLLGRLNSAYRLVAWGTMPLGAALGGILAGLVGLRVVFAIMGVLSLGLVLLMLPVRHELARLAPGVDAG